MLIAHITDSHVRPLGKACYRVVDTNCLLDRAVDTLNALTPRPDCVVHTGDVAANGLDEEYAVARAALSRLTVPVYLVPGNHDRRAEMRAAFVDGPYVFEHDEFWLYSVDGGAARIVALDTVVPGHGHGALCRTRLDWLDAKLTDAPEQPTVIIMHHPPFQCGIDHMDRIALTEGQDVFADIVHAHPQVERVLCGHHHRPIQARFAGTLAQVAPSIAHQVMLDLAPNGRAAFTLEPAAFLLHRYAPDTGVVSHQAHVERFPGPYPFVEEPEYPGALI